MDAAGATEPRQDANGAGKNAPGTGNKCQICVLYVYVYIYNIYILYWVSSNMHNIVVYIILSLHIHMKTDGWMDRHVSP